MGILTAQVFEHKITSYEADGVTPIITAFGPAAGVSSTTEIESNYNLAVDPMTIEIKETGETLSYEQYRWTLKILEDGAEIAASANTPNPFGSPRLPADELPATLATEAYVNLKQSQLEKITENAKTGWRLLDVDPDSYGEIGTDAVDFSISDGTASTTRGATGENAFAANLKTTASGANSAAFNRGTVASGLCGFSTGRGTSSGDYSFSAGWLTDASGSYSSTSGYKTTAKNSSSSAAGQHNVGASDYTIHETGIGSDVGSEANGYEIWLNGVLTAPELTIDLVNDPTSSGDFDGDASKVLITKEYEATTRQRIVQLGKNGNLSDGNYLRVASVAPSPTDGMAFDRDYIVESVVLTRGGNLKIGTFTIFNITTNSVLATLTTTATGEQEFKDGQGLTPFTIPALDKVNVYWNTNQGGNPPVDNIMTITMLEA